MSSLREIFFDYICPTLGGLIASTLFAAPINDLRNALRNETLGPLNPNPWAVMSGNCLGWCAYSYYTKDPFILAANLPGFVLSLWLNIGAAKLQYLAQVEYVRKRSMSVTASHHRPRHLPHGGGGDAADAVSKEGLVHAPQDVLLLRIMGLWAGVLVLVGWMGVLQGHEAQMVGLVVNINLIFFYAAPLQTVKTVLEHSCSDSLHTPTVLLNCLCATFWMLYGIARNDIIVYGPNGIGLALGTAQLALLVFYPKSYNRRRPVVRVEAEFQPVHDADPEDTDEPELAHPLPPTL